MKYHRGSQPCFGSRNHLDVHTHVFRCTYVDRWRSLLPLLLVGGIPTSSFCGSIETRSVPVPLPQSTILRFCVKYIYRTHDVVDSLSAASCMNAPKTEDFLGSVAAIFARPPVARSIVAKAPTVFVHSWVHIGHPGPSTTFSLGSR